MAADVARDVGPAWTAGDDPDAGPADDALRPRAVNYHTGETVVLTRRRKRRKEVAELLQAVLARHPTGTVYVAWDNADTHRDDDVEAVVRGAAGRLVLLYLPTYSPWLNPIEMLWRHFRRQVTHCELFVSVQALREATHEFFDRHNRTPDTLLSVIGAHPAGFASLYLDGLTHREAARSEPAATPEAQSRAPLPTPLRARRDVAQPSLARAPDMAA